VLLVGTRAHGLVESSRLRGEPVLRCGQVLELAMRNTVSTIAAIEQQSKNTHQGCMCVPGNRAHLGQRLHLALHALRLALGGGSFVAQRTRARVELLALGLRVPEQFLELRAQGEREGRASHGNRDKERGERRERERRERREREERERRESRERERERKIYR